MDESARKKRRVDEEKEGDGEEEGSDESDASGDEVECSECGTTFALNDGIRCSGCSELVCYDCSKFCDSCNDSKCSDCGDFKPGGDRTLVCYGCQPWHQQRRPGSAYCFDCKSTRHPAGNCLGCGWRICHQCADNSGLKCGHCNDLYCSACCEKHDDFCVKCCDRDGIFTCAECCSGGHSDSDDEGEGDEE